MSKRKILTGRIYVNDSTEDGLPEKEVPKRDYSSVQTPTTDSFNSTDYTLYAVETVSGKPINHRIYDKSSVKGSIMDGKWNKPYNKRLIKNHNSYGDYSVQGMISDAHFIDLEDSTGHCSYNPSNPLPSEVRDIIISDNAIGDGIGVVEFIPNKDYLDKLLNFDGTIFSQSSYYEKCTCNICNNDYWGMECSHGAGRTYQISIPGTDLKQDKICYPIMTGDREPVELSTVVSPANNTSILYVYDKKNKKVCRADSFDLSLLQNNSSSSSDSSSKDSNELDDKKSSTDSFSKYYNVGVVPKKNEEPKSSSDSEENKEPKGEVKMLSDAQKKLTSKTIDALLANASDSVKENFNKLLEKVSSDEKATEDQLLLLVDCAEILKDSQVATATEDSKKIEEYESRLAKIEDSLKKEDSNNDEEQKDPSTDEKDSSKDEKKEDPKKQSNDYFVI